MTLIQLTTFVTVAKHRNVSQAAIELHVVQGAVSQQLKALETQCKAKLYRRNSGGVALTREGEIFLRHANAILNELQKLNKQFHVGLPENKVQSLTVCGSFDPSASFLPQILANFNRSHPKVELDLRTDNRVVIERMLLKGEAEIAVINNVPRNPQLVSEPYLQREMVIFAHANHPLTRRRDLTLRDLVRMPLIIRQAKGVRGSTEQILNQLEPGLKPNVVLRCESPDAVKMAVRKKMGIGILYLSVVQADIRNRDFKIVKLSGVNLKGKSYIIYHGERPLSDHARTFLALLHQWRRKGQRGKDSLPLAV